jgi:hypothetical protein
MLRSAAKQRVSKHVASSFETARAAKRAAGEGLLFNGVMPAQAGIQ